jgi:cobalamin 5'-phosphate synthase/cobalamin synthase
LIREFLLALGFLTHLPAWWSPCTPKEIGQAARWFPLVGGVLGAIYIGALRLLILFFPPLIVSVLIIALDALLTGAMHFDGLADTADGFGAGHAPEDVLRIMRDHAIGSYGTSALFLALALKIAAIDALIGSAYASPALLLAPVLGRWSAVFSPAVAGYARPVEHDAPRSVGSPARFIGRSELIVATLIAAAFAVAFPQWRTVIAAVLVAATIAGWTSLCRRRIGGVTGDTLGAGIAVAECLVLLTFSAQS